LKLIRSAAETEALASSLADNRGVYLVPAFTGLGAPHWRPDARAVLSGLTLDSGPAEIARAVLESVAYQTCDLVEEMRGAVPGSGVLRADGGMTANGFLMQFLADMLDTPVEVPEVAETTALGAAFLAGLQVGMFDDLQQLSRLWRRGAAYHRIMTGEARARAYGGWRAALSRL
ncbi:MAG TPA: FGGY-family carbohydrate kinase, partial [Sphingomonadales bacterium]